MGSIWGPPARRTARLVMAMSVAMVVAIAFTWAFVLRGPSADNIVSSAVVDVIALYCFFLAGLVAVRRPGNAVGPLLGLFALTMAVLGATSAYDAGYAIYPERFHVSPYYVAFGQAAFELWYIPPALLMLYFPNGRLLSRRWRVVVVGLFVVLAVGTLVGPFSSETFDRPYDKLVNPLPQATGALAVVANILTFGVFLLGLLALLIACLVSMIIRYRRSTGIERAQLKWFAFGASALPGALLLCWLALLVFGNDDILAVGLLVLVIWIPTATTIGLLRHQLYDVDRAVATTVSYAVITVVLVALYGIASFVGGVTLGHSSAAVAAAATAICALALSPLHQRLRRIVDRRLYPIRRRTLGALAELRTDIHRGVGDPEQLATVLRQALADPGLRVGYRPPGSSVDVDLTGASVPGPGTPVMLADEQVGVLVSTGAISRSLLKEVADASALMVEVVRLRSGLTRALHDVESSRSRLLQASYEERRRLERDLHDGAQQRLVALGMNLRVAQRHLSDGTVDLDHLLDGTVDELAAAVTDLRHIAHGLRPSSLDDGLESALTGLLGRLPIPVAVFIDHGPLPDEVATTAFFVTSEAVTNAIKHAAADRIAVDIRRRDADLVVQVSDNGRGGAAVRAGAGLAGLTDRVAALGGALTVRDRADHGTLVLAVLPCAS